MDNLTDNGETQTGQSRGNLLDSAWLAGIIDGEACFSVTFGGKKRKTVSPRCSIGNTSLSLMRKVQKTVENLSGQRLRIKPRDLKTNHVVFMIEIVRHQTLIAVLNQVLPYLTAKREQAIEVSFFCESRANRESYHAPYTEHQWDLSNRLKTLNRAHFVSPEEVVETKREAPSYPN